MASDVSIQARWDRLQKRKSQLLKEGAVAFDNGDASTARERAQTILSIESYLDRSLKELDGALSIYCKGKRAA